MGFTSDGTLKVMDFGLASIIESVVTFSDDVYKMTGGTGSLRYMAPEVAKSRPYNHKADVYSFGIILWELLSFKKPFVGYGLDKFYDQVVNNGVRPNVDSKWPKDLKDLISSCWDAEIGKRPNFQEIVAILEAIDATSIPKIAQRRRLSLPNIRRRSLNHV